MKSKQPINNYPLFSWHGQLLTTSDVASNHATYEWLNGSANDGRKYSLSLMLWLVGVQCQTAMENFRRRKFQKAKSRRHTEVKSLLRKILGLPYPVILGGS
jgi:outer membrane biogenesis lipoprotein LolB